MEWSKNGLEMNICLEVLENKAHSRQASLLNRSYLAISTLWFCEFLRMNLSTFGAS